MPRIANFCTNFCKKNSGGRPPDDPRPHFQYNFFFLFCPPPPSSPLFGAKLRHWCIQISYWFEWYPIIITLLHITWMIPHIIIRLCTTLDLLSNFEHLRRVWHADRGRLLLRTPGPVPWGLACVLLVETSPFSELVVIFRTMLFEYPSVLSRFCISLNL